MYAVINSQTLYANSLYANTLVYPAEGLKDEEAGILDEVIKAGDKEEIIDEHCLALPKLLLGPVKVKVDVQAFKELRDGIPVHVRLLEWT